MNTKISVLRQFGSENFSMSVDFDHVIEEKDIHKAVKSIGVGITSAFDQVLVRGEEEKIKLSGVSKIREESNKRLADQLDSEMKEATRGKDIIRKVEKLNRK